MNVYFFLHISKHEIPNKLHNTIIIVYYFTWTLKPVNLFIIMYLYTYQMYEYKKMFCIEQT